jgi:hypothetical protein
MNSISLEQQIQAIASFTKEEIKKIVSYLNMIHLNLKNI